MPNSLLSHRVEEGQVEEEAIEGEAVDEVVAVVVEAEAKSVRKSQRKNLSSTLANIKTKKSV
jgi:hypothetical protein